MPVPDFPRSRKVLAEDVHLTSSDGVALHGAYYQCPETIETPLSARPTVLFFHGNAGDVVRWSHVAIRWQNALGANVLLLDYRGYGKSGGTPSEEGVYLDSRAAYRWLIDEKKVEGPNLIIAGQSLGGAIAAELATSGDADHAGLVLESTFSELNAVGDKALSMLTRFWQRQFWFPTSARLTGYQKPLLLSHGGRDLLIPKGHANKLETLTSGPCLLLSYPKMGHHDRRREDYERSARVFFVEHLSAKT